MQAVNEGAGSAHSFGINIRLPFEQQPNPVVAGNPRSINYKYFFNRKVAFLKEADAVVLFPGGFGTLDEAMETLTLVQTGKRNPLPVVMIEPPGQNYWASWVAFLQTQMERAGYIHGDDLNLLEVTSSVAAGVGHITRFYRRYHSLRHVGSKLVVRLKAPLAPRDMDALRLAFRDILLPGGELTMSQALPQESDEPELADLPRLIVDFNRTRFARLKALIDFLNELPLADAGDGS